MASARAGNVIGGGDWGADRLIPDIMRAVAQSRKVVIRNPRPSGPGSMFWNRFPDTWLWGKKLLDGQKEFADAWNFGPADEGHLSVGDLVRKIKTIWPKIDYEIQQDPAAPHEAGLLRLDCSKARLTLPWTPAWSGQDAIGNTAGWYRMFYESGKIDSAETSPLTSRPPGQRPGMDERMIFSETRLTDAFLIFPERIEDERGFFPGRFAGANSRRAALPPTSFSAICPSTH